MTSDEISGLILVGGRSARMGFDKGLLLLEQRPLVSYAIDCLAQICNRILICASSWNAANYSNLGLELVVDKFPELGPIAGLISGMERLESELVAVAPCDTPLISPKLYRALLAQLGDHQVSVPIFNSKIQPLHGIYRRSPALNAFLRAVSQGEFRPIAAFKYLKVRYLIPEQLQGFDPSWFLNVNTCSDLELAAKILNELS